jgi:hypothetical protein
MASAAKELPLCAFRRRMRAIGYVFSTLRPVIDPDISLALGTREWG